MGIPAALRRQAEAELERRRGPAEATAPDPISFAEFVEREWMPEVIDVEQPPEVADAPHLREWADLIESHPFVGIVAFRYSLKSVLAKAAIAHELRQFQRGIFEGFYFSSSVTLAREHLMKLKLYVSELARSWGWRDATAGKAMLHYERPGATFIVKPDGVDSKQRSRRANTLVLDDLLDPQKPLSMADVSRVLEAMRRRILPLLKGRTSRVLFFGTPIVRDDPTAWVEQNPRFVTTWLPIIDPQGNPTWPELYPSDRIAELRDLVGDKTFASEYLLEETDTLASYVDRELLNQCVASLEPHQLQRRAS